MDNLLERACAAWEAEGKHGSVQERVERAKRWLPYYGMIAGRQSDQWNDEGTPAMIAEQLTRIGALNDYSTVLYIGAGCGGYALALARRCAWVRALDMSEESLMVIRRRAQRSQIGNIQCVRGAWESFDSGQYSFVFSAMCPAICNYAELRRMESLSRGYCALVTVGKGSYDLRRREHMRRLDVHPSDGMATTDERYCEILTLMGRQPNTYKWTSREEFERSPEEFIETQRVYMDIFGVDPEQANAEIRAYCDEITEDGVIHDVSHLNLTLITWRPDKKTDKVK